MLTRPKRPGRVSMAPETFSRSVKNIRDSHTDIETVCDPIVEGLVRASAATAGAHQAYLRFAQRAREDLGRTLSLGSELTSGLGDLGGMDRGR